MRKFLLNRLVKKALINRSYCGWSAVKSVQIIYDLTPEQPRPEIAHLERALKKEGKKVELLEYNLGKKPKENIPNNTYFKADANLLGATKSWVLNCFQEDADVLIDWTLLEGTPNDFLAVMSNSGLKLCAGRSMEIFDLAINAKETMPGKVIDEILKYLKMINHE